MNEMFVPLSVYCGLVCSKSRLLGWLQARTSLILEKAAERARQARVLDIIAGISSRNETYEWNDFTLFFLLYYIVLQILLLCNSSRVVNINWNFLPYCNLSCADKLRQGPLGLLVRCHEERARIQVWTRHTHGIRGTMVGFLRALDKHFNMVRPSSVQR